LLREVRSILHDARINLARPVVVRSGSWRMRPAGSTSNFFSGVKHQERARVDHSIRARRSFGLLCRRLVL